jgi:general secretion pathway protein K
MAGAKRMSRQQGVVLLSMLLILALLSALAYQIVGRHSLLVAQARYSFGQDQALAYAIGAETLARQVLYQDFTETGAGVDTFQEIWAQPLAPFEIEQGMMEVQVRDLNGCFNLNSLAGEGAEQNHARLKTLLRNLAIPETYADSWRDWVDADEEIVGFGAEDGDYLLLEDGYRTANRAAGHTSELKLIRDMTAEYYELLRDHVCVLPSDELRLNVNTAGFVAMAGLSPALSIEQMQAFAEAERTYTEVGQVTNEYPDLAGSAEALSVTSEYFEVQVRAQVGDSRVEMASLLRRDQNDGSITLISRDLGKDFRSLFAVDADDSEG